MTAPDHIASAFPGTVAIDHVMTLRERRTTPPDMRKVTKVKVQVLSCAQCELRKECRKPVPFRGSVTAPYAVLGEAPGRKEDEQGKPFVGPAGKMLNKVLKRAGFTDVLAPSEAFYLNVASCWPRLTGTPHQKHVDACRVNRESQMRLYQGNVVIVAGAVALSALRPDLSISGAHGKPFHRGGVLYYPVFHPAALFRDSMLIRPTVEDLIRLRKVLRGDWDPAHLLGDRCANGGCGAWATEWDREGMSWCSRHRQGAQDRQALVKRKRKVKKIPGQEELI